MDKATKKIFRTALEKYYLTAKKNNMSAAYKMMIKEFYTDDIYYENGEEKIIISDEDKLPTLRQFRYWYQKEYGTEATLIAREGRRKYEKDHRPVLGSSTSEVFGPGSRYQIDATVADVYLISRYNPNWIIGRPVLYLIVDVFSRMIVGMYVGLEGPSWAGAMMALANAASDKVSFCAQYGIRISKADWPCEDLPEVLLADRGELEGYNIERLIDAFNLHVENAVPYRADWKGIVEKQFDVVQKRVKPFLPGYVEKDFQQRGARDYRLDAKLTLEQFTQVMIKQIIMYNTKHYLDGYIRDEDMIRDEVEPYPLQLWNDFRGLIVDTNTVIKYSKAETGKSEPSNKDNTLLQGKQKEWIDLMDKHPTLTVTQLRWKNSALYAWLYRNCREWLSQHSPTGKTRVKGQVRIDWEKRDQRLVKQVQKAIKETLLESPPIRITVHRIASQLRKRALFSKHLEKLSQTKQCLESAAETVEQFQIRRVRWAIMTLEETGEEVLEWRVRRLAALPSAVSPKVEAEAKYYPTI